MQENVLQQARALAAEVLRDEIRYDGTPFFQHPDGVARIVSDEVGLPESCQVAVYLHEATRAHKEVDISSFPADVLEMVDGLNKISTIKPKDTRLEAENYKKLIVQYSTDPRVTVIKIADRLEVMRKLGMFPSRSRQQKLLETLMLYIPLAHQLGLYNMKREMEDIYLKWAEPQEYKNITQKLKATEKDRERLSAEFIEPLKIKLDSEGIKYKLKVRTKSAYPIYRKMQVQGVPFEGVFDVFAIRFIIDCPPDPKTEKDLCWKVYSHVTSEYTPDLGRLRDWLTNPKPNGYESLHITVANKDGNALEVQIRTKRMDDEAENGAAAHWAYKGIRHEQTMDRWLKSVRWNLEHPADFKPEDLPEPPAREIFVFTPTGELRTLSAGASVLDFAFCIHSNVGSRCTGGKVNGRTVQIKEKLKTGDVVEVLTSKNQRPSRDWLNYVVTSKARGKIKQELDFEERKTAAEGREILERRLRNWKLEMTDSMMAEFIKSHKFQSVLPFMAAIAREEVDLNEIKTFIQKYEENEAAKIEALRQAETAKALQGADFSSSGDDILVINAKNVKGLEYKMAKCCNPVFGDDVFGFVTRSQGITIHRESCPNASRLKERYGYRVQKVVWQDNPGSGSFQAGIKIETEPDHALLSKIMDVITQFKASIRSFNVSEREHNHAAEYLITARIQVPSNSELDKIITLIGRLPKVSKAYRG